MARVTPSERFRVELDEALAGVGQDQDPEERVGRLLDGYLLESLADLQLRDLRRALDERG